MKARTASARQEFSPAHAQVTVPPRPFLKWAGGKNQLMPELLARLPKSFKAYHEPFVGGGALFFALASSLSLRKVYISDVNEPLIETYLGLKKDVDGVVSRLRRHKYDEEYYYKVRAQKPSRLSLASRAARLIYLNKTCYNGLYRENRSGQFNVPFGKVTNPRICDKPNLKAVSYVLQGVGIGRRHFSTVLDKAKKGDFVYFDPPYHPLSTTASFTSYDRNGFGGDDQVELRDVFTALDEHGVYVMLSNSGTDFIRELYASFSIETVHAKRAINSKADRRGKVAELIVRNYP